MKKFMICAITLFLLLSTSVFGDTPPGNVQATFKKMYPKANVSPGHKMTDIIAPTL